MDAATLLSAVTHLPAAFPAAPVAAHGISGVPDWEVILLAVLAALGGGAFGAAIGALPAFVMTGFLVIAGAVAASLNLKGAAASIYAIAWGPLFGPQVGFQAGTAAAAYAARYRPDVLEDPKNILVPLGVEPDILVVGAVFGGVAQILKMATDIVDGSHGPMGFAHIAWIIVVLALVHRAVFGYSIIGDREKVEEAGSSWLSFYHNEGAAHAPYQFYFGEGALLGGLIGLVAGWGTIMTGSPWLMFGVSAATLVFLETQNGLRADLGGRAGFPITHQITLPASVAALAAYGMSNPPIPGANGFWWALVMAIVFGILGEWFRLVGDRLLFAWGETHLDPPAFSIVFSVALIVIFSAAGLIGHNAYLGIGPHWY